MFGSGHRLDACAEARHATRGGVLDRAALDLRLRCAQCSLRCLLVAGGDRLLDLLDRAAHAAAACRIHGSAGLCLAGALLGRLMISHLVLVTRRARLYGPHGDRSSAPKPPNQRCFQPALRFSAKAAIPSARSSKAKVAWKVRRSK